MCRLLGMISDRAFTAEKYLAEAECSLLKQSMIDSKRLQGDGWGIGYYVDGLPSVVKSEKPVYSEVQKFRSAASQTRSRIILAHVRRASNPRGLSRERLLSVENSQPFHHGRFVFVHNGTVNIPDEVAELLGRYRMMVKGINDSEIYFWFVMKEMEAGKDVSAALINFEDTLQQLWSECSSRHVDKSRPYAGLNVVISDGERLYAYCRYAEERSRSICLQDQPVFQMCYLPGNPFIVASEKLTRNDQWLPLKSGQLLKAEARDGLVVESVQTLR